MPSSFSPADTAATSSPAATERPVLVLVDGHALAYRMYFALESTGMAAADQTPTWGVYGFFNALTSMLKTVRPDALALTFDVSRESFRTALYADYKANRAAMPDTMRQQMSLIREGVDALGIPVFEQAGFEADDLIGTLCDHGVVEGFHVQILTGDQDAFQLVLDGQVSVLLPPRSPREPLRLFDRQAVFDKWGVYPEQVPDFKALKGDSSDNIPGVPGIGDKTAAKLLAQFGTVEAMYEQLPLAGTLKLQEKLKTYEAQARLCKELALIRRDVPVTVDWSQCRLSPPDDSQAWLAFCERCGFRSFIRQYDSWHQLMTLGQPAIDADDPDLDFDFSASPAQSETLPSVRLITAEADWLAWLETLKARSVFALDLETQGLDILDNPIVGIAMAVANGLSVSRQPAVNLLGLDDMPADYPILESKGLTNLQVVYVPLRHQTDSPQLSPEQVIADLAPLLQDPAFIKVMHHAKFERTVFAQLGLSIDGLVFDTILASYVLNADRKHGLKALGQSVLGLDMTSFESVTRSTLAAEADTTVAALPDFAKVPLDTAATYAGADAAVTLMLADRFAAELDDDRRTLLYEVELPLEAVLADMEHQGIRLDVAYLKTLSEQLGGELQQLEQDIYALAGGKAFNLNSPKQVGEVLFERLGIQPLKKTATKAFSTDAKVLEQLRGEHPVVNKLLAYRQLFKLKSTYIDALPTMIHPQDGRLHTRFNQTVTATGRLSSSQPNLQNIPIRSKLGKQIRKAFIPEPGWRLISTDYSQIELRMLAHFSEDPALIAAFQANVDIHTATAALVFNISADQVQPEQRYRAKTVNFGVVYGQSAHSLSQQLGVSRAEAQQFIDAYFKQYSRVRATIERTQEEAHRQGYVTTLLHRRRDLSADLRSKNRSVREFAERAAFNTPLQGSAADLIKLAMIRLHQRLRHTGSSARLLLQVHDEMVLECPPAELDLVKDAIIWAMGLNQPLRVPLVSDVVIGDNWLEA